MIEATLLAILILVVGIAIRQEMIHMATKQEFLDQIADIRADIQALKDKLAAGGMTADEEAEVLAELAKLSGEN